MNELTWPQRGRLWLRLGLRLVLTLLVVFLLWKVLPPMLSLLMPFVLALVLAWMLNPLIRVLQKKVHVRRGVLSLVLVLAVVAVVGGLLAGLVYSLASQVASLVQNWSTVWDGVLSGVNAVVAVLEELIYPLPEETYLQVTSLLEKLVEWLSGVAPQMLANGATHAGSFAMSLPSWGVGVIIFLMATYFISADYPALRLQVTQWVPQEFRGFCSQLKHVTLDAFGGYVRAEAIISVVVFFILLGGFLLIGEPYALLLAFILGVMDFIPIIGAGTVMVPWAVVDVALGNYRHAISLMLVWGVIVLFRRVAEPKVVGDQTGLSPIASLISIYVGMKLWNVLGMILGPVICLVVLGMTRGGLFDNTVQDLRLAVRDISAILSGSATKLPKR